jgi:hypothetical protein
MPEAGKSEIFEKRELGSRTFSVLAAAYFLVIAIILAITARS